MIEDILENILDNLSEEVDELDRLMAVSPDSELLELGKRYLSDGNYHRAMRILSKNARSDHSSRYIARLYPPLIKGILIYSNPFFNIKTEKPIIDPNKFMDSVIECLVISTQMHAEGELPKEDLFDLEKLVDKISFEKITFSGRDEFKKLYGKFKEYTIKVSLGEK